MKLFTLLALSFSLSLFAAPKITCYKKGSGTVKAVVNGIKQNRGIKSFQVGFYKAFNNNGQTGKGKQYDTSNSNSGTATLTIYGNREREQIYAKVFQYNCQGGGSCHEKVGPCKIYKNL